MLQRIPLFPPKRGTIIAFSQSPRNGLRDNPLATPSGCPARNLKTVCGGLKETKYRLLMQQKPELAMQLAVRGMLPRNIITKDSLSRLHIYRGAEHPHTAQKPETWAAI